MGGYGAQAKARPTFCTTGTKENQVVKKEDSENKMKKGIHPENYRLCAFRDMSNGETFITHSTAETKDTVEIDGVTYPLVKLEISSTSHPFYTGKVKLVDTAGRVDKFRKKYGVK